jgi:hypothetical protein
MKIYLLLFTVFLFSCNTEKEEATPPVFPAAYEAEPEWTEYEGNYPDGKGNTLTLQLSLMTGGVGTDNQYKFYEHAYDCDCVFHGGSAQGSYSTMYGANPSETIIQLHGKGYLTYVTAGKVTQGDLKKFVTDQVEKEIEMYFRSDGDDKLTAVDKNFTPLSGDGEFILHRRSRPFTVEGYLTFDSDTAEFYEMNTSENWIVAKLGGYKTAKRQYLENAREKFEGVYVKGLAYTVRHVNAKGKGIDALVLRRIFEIRPGKKP